MTHALTSQLTRWAVWLFLAVILVFLYAPLLSSMVRS